MEEALKVAHRIAENWTLAVQIVKKLAVETSHLAPAEFILRSNDARGLMRDTKDRIEARTAFGEKRKPKYTGNSLAYRNAAILLCKGNHSYFWGGGTN